MRIQTLVRRLQREPEAHARQTVPPDKAALLNLCALYRYRTLGELRVHGRIQLAQTLRLMHAVSDTRGLTLSLPDRLVSVRPVVRPESDLWF